MVELGTSGVRPCPAIAIDLIHAKQGPGGQACGGGFGAVSRRAGHQLLEKEANVPLKCRNIVQCLQTDNKVRGSTLPLNQARSRHLLRESPMKGRLLEENSEDLRQGRFSGVQLGDSALGFLCRRILE